LKAEVKIYRLNMFLGVFNKYYGVLKQQKAKAAVPAAAVEVGSEIAVPGAARSFCNAHSTDLYIR